MYSHVIPVSNGPSEHNNRSKLLVLNFNGAYLPATDVLHLVHLNKNFQNKLILFLDPPDPQPPCALNC